MRGPIRRLVVVGTGVVVAFGIVGFNLFFGPIHCRFPDDPEHKVRTGARVVRSAVQSWQAARSPTECPGLAQLNSERYLDRGISGVDPWGTEYRISCTNEEVTVSSAGPDRRWGTGDDTRVPNK